MLLLIYYCSTLLYTVSQKRDLCASVHNSGKYWRIFKFFSLLNLVINLQQNYYIAHHTLNMLLHYLANWKLLILLFCKHNRAHETVVLLQREVPAFIAPNLWPNSPDLNSVDYKVWGTMQDCVYQTKVRDVEDLKQRLIDIWDSLGQSVIDDAIDQWRSQLSACVHAKGDILNSLCSLHLNFIINWHFVCHYWSWMNCFNMKMSLFVTTVISQGSVATDVKCVG